MVAAAETSPMAAAPNSTITITRTTTTGAATAASTAAAASSTAITAMAAATPTARPTRATTTPMVTGLRADLVTDRARFTVLRSTSFTCRTTIAARRESALALEREIEF
ncbi:MAG: hypothetical protein CTY15_04590 [Methylocystis sp.]|nr:MAG: hypothetical protein CTY15_04590 [Methylocystis sp.]